MRAGAGPHSSAGTSTPAATGASAPGPDACVQGQRPAGLIALAPALRALPLLEGLYLRDNSIDNSIGDDGVAALVAPGEGVLPSLERLDLEGNWDITDAGCASIVSAIQRGVLPALTNVELWGVGASEAAVDAVHELVDGSA